MLRISSRLMPIPPPKPPPGKPKPAPPAPMPAFGSSDPVISYNLFLSGSLSSSYAFTTFSNFYFARGSYLFLSGWYCRDLLLKAFFISSSVADLEIPSTLYGSGVLAQHGNPTNSTKSTKKMKWVNIFILRVINYQQLIINFPVFSKLIFPIYKLLNQQIIMLQQIQQKIIKYRWIGLKFLRLGYIILGDEQ